jgi:ribosomal protein S18 acetylase RimI-like enzyme
MWSMLQAVITPGDTLPFASDFGREAFESQWSAPQLVHVAATDADVSGMYKLGPNHAGRGSHVATATYVVDPAAQGKGVGRALVEHSILQAQAAGYLAMQFNYVVSTNRRAVELYQRLGFTIVGTLPKAFRHRELGLVDAYVMHRFLAADEANTGH